MERRPLLLVMRCRRLQLLTVDTVAAEDGSCLLLQRQVRWDGSVRLSTSRASSPRRRRGDTKSRSNRVVLPALSAAIKIISSVIPSSIFGLNVALATLRWAISVVVSIRVLISHEACTAGLIHRTVAVGRCVPL